MRDRFWFIVKFIWFIVKFIWIMFLLYEGFTNKNANWFETVAFTLLFFIWCNTEVIK